MHAIHLRIRGAEYKDDEVVVTQVCVCVCVCVCVLIHTIHGRKNETIMILSKRNKYYII